MLRQREKFERIDVPRDNNPYRNIIGAGVVVAVCIVVTLVCVTLWNRVQLESHSKRFPRMKWRDIRAHRMNLPAYFF